MEILGLAPLPENPPTDFEVRVGVRFKSLIFHVTLLVIAPAESLGPEPSAGPGPLRSAVLPGGRLP